MLWKGRIRGTPSTSADTSCPLQHMLRTVSSHGGFSAFIEADGDFFSKMVQVSFLKLAVWQHPTYPSWIYPASNDKSSSQGEADHRETNRNS